MIFAMDDIRQDQLWSISQLCEGFGMKRDAYYKYQRRNNRSKARKAKLLSMVREKAQRPGP